MALYMLSCTADSEPSEILVDKTSTLDDIISWLTTLYQCGQYDTLISDVKREDETTLSYVTLDGMSVCYFWRD